MRRWILIAVVTMFVTIANGQVFVKGIVLDSETNKPLMGANVVVKGNILGVITDINGEFQLPVSSKIGQMQVSHLGFTSRSVTYRVVGNNSKIKILLKPDVQVLSGIVVSDRNTLLDLAYDRKTPVAVSTIFADEIIEKLGNREFPELLKRTPSVHTVNSGGYGDAKINIRGFSTENIAVMINGMPVNDMENGKVYWSNWLGISDISSGMQVQRGLGASKLAIASVGGTINILTRPSAMKEGGFVSAYAANSGEYKTSVNYNTGKNENGFSASFLFGHTGGAKYIDATEFKAYNYYIALQYEASEKHDFRFVITGAPQWHRQGVSHISIADAIKYGTDGNPNRRYSSDWGYWKGSVYNAHRNVYHKPVFMFNWDWNLSQKSSLTTTAYTSFGRGYGTTMYGSVNGKTLNSFRDPQTGEYNFDQVEAENRASTPDAGVLVRGASVNSHDWYGILSNYNYDVSDGLSLNLGIDGRYYRGYHYGIVNELFGASAYRDESNANLITPNYVQTANLSSMYNPFAPITPIKNTIGYNNIGEVYWLGTFGQVEYATEDTSTFLQASISEKGYQRIDNFLLEGTYVRGTTIPMYRKTGFEKMFGYNVKGGVNQNIGKHNVFLNVGFYERQPSFDAVYRGEINYVSPDNVNEKILGIELGYGFKGTNFDAKLNLYRTTWKDRAFRQSNLRDVDLAQTYYYAEITGLQEVHQGLELELAYTANEYLQLRGMFSHGDWYYDGNAEARTYRDRDLRPYILVNALSDRVSLLLDKAKVGGTAQTTANLGATITPAKNCKLDIDWRYVDNLYANVGVYAFIDAETASRGTLKLPSYNLFDIGMSYRLPLFGKQSMLFRFNVNNLLDTYYIT